MPRLSSIGKQANEQAKSTFSAKLESLLQLDPKLQALFPSEADKQELASLIEIVESAADENESKAKIIAEIGEVSGAVIRLSRKALGLL